MPDFKWSETKLPSESEVNELKNAINVNRIVAKRLNVVLNVLFHRIHQGENRDDCHDSDGDSEKRKDGAQFV